MLFSLILQKIQDIIEITSSVYPTPQVLLKWLSQLNLLWLSDV